MRRFLRAHVRPFLGRAAATGLLFSANLHAQTAPLPDLASVNPDLNVSKRHCGEGNWTFVPLLFRNHSDAWVLRNLPERRQLRVWLARVLAEPARGR